MNKNILNKNNLPKYFNVMVEYVTGDSETFECASWRYFTDFVEYLTTDNTMVQVYYNNVKAIKYDKKFTRIIEEANKAKETVKEENK